MAGVLTFPAIRGTMGGHPYYVLLLPLSVVPTLLWVPDGQALTPEARAQRRLNEKRIPEITRYILDHEDSWVFSSLTASFDVEENFVSSELDENMGQLHLPITAKLLVNDGQHRRAAIERALREDPTIGDQTISVVLFPAEDLTRNQQMFSDLNRTVQKTSRSLDIMYDHRDPLNQITLAMERRVPLLRGRIEKESQSLAVRSAKFITVSALYDMSSQFVGNALGESSKESELQAWEDRLAELWQILTDVLRAWQDVANGDLRPAEARAEFINCHAVFFFAIGGACRSLLDREELSRLENLKDIDWSRTNKDWQGICMLGPDVITRRQTRTALREEILWRLGILSSPPEPALSL